ncbi:MAG: hypothetical protein EBV83_07640 [Verrucomicrobia bacterium]|nr:hypothetical protein [Verrucomicrobiota bacterium]
MRSRASGFSLTEVVVALGVATVAFTTLMGLFPLGLQSSRESYDETQAALLAMTINSDLRDFQQSSRAGFRLIQVGLDADPSANTPVNYLDFDINDTNNIPRTIYIAYRLQRVTNALGNPEMLRPFTNIPASSFTNGISNAAAIGSLKFFPILNKTWQVEFSLETPGFAAQNKRNRQVFVGSFR